MRLRIAIAVVAGGNSHHHVGDVQVIDGDRHEVLGAVRIATQAQVHDVHAIGVGGLERIEDVFRAGVLDIAREHVVVAEEGPRGATPDGSYGMSAVPTTGRRVVVAGDRACHVRAVRIDRLRVEAVLVDLVVEDPGDDDLVVGVLELALREARRRRVAGVIEAGMILVDAGVDDADLDAGPGIRLPANLGPGARGVDQGEVDVIGRRVGRVPAARRA